MNILAIHPSSELYGSDKSFADALSGLVGDGHHVTAALTKPGPLVDVLRARGIGVEFCELGQIHRAIFTPLGILGWFSALLRGARQVRALSKARKFDLLYVNTVALPFGALASRLLGIPVVWHVREIILRPRIVSRLLRWVVDRFSDRVLCNSQATLEWCLGAGRCDRRYSVVWNGVATDSREHSRPEAEERMAAKSKLGTGDRLVVMLPGRINAWKGQDLLLEAVERLPEPLRVGLVVLFVGGVAETGGEWWEALERRIRSAKDPGIYRMEGFQSDMSLYYAASDLVVIPSKEPEPFGRVAIEAMSRGCPIVAADHGGLSEIVVHGETGLLFPPRKSQELSQAVASLLEDGQARASMGGAGRRRVETCFSLGAYQKSIVKALEAAVADAQRG